MPDEHQNNFEQTRIDYKPDIIKVLMVAESPPAAGHFFYEGDAMCTYTKRAFSNASENITENTLNQDFLVYYKLTGFYLEDLCHEPINNQDNNEKEANRNAGIPLLTQKLNEFNPRVIICCMKAIRKHIIEAIKQSNLGNFLFYTLPFPSQGNQNDYITGLTEILKELKKFEIIYI